MPQEVEGEFFDFDSLGSADHSTVGILLLSVGAPETCDDVEEYLYNVFCDPEIMTLPPSISWALKRPLAWFIAKQKAPEARESMLMLEGGRSPQLSSIHAQSEALEAALIDRGINARMYLSMRYWHPYPEEAVEQMKADGIKQLVILPLYPQFSISTSGSSLRVLERMLYTDPNFPLKSTVIPAWYNRKGYLTAQAASIAQVVNSLPNPKDAHILYSAQGLPRKYVDDLGDPYADQIQRTVKLVNAELEALGLQNSFSLGYQGQFGPQQLRWLEPSTTDEVRTLAGTGAKALVLVPISFVFEHMGTVREMDVEYAELAASLGIDTFLRVPTLSVDPDFIDALAGVVIEALPDLSRPSMQQINEGNPVSLNMVNEYTRLYTKDQLKLVPQEQPWGFTEQAEVVNGRIAMTAITLSIALTVDPTLKALVAMYHSANQ